MLSWKATKIAGRIFLNFVETSKNQNDIRNYSKKKKTKKKARKVNREFKITFAPKICDNPHLKWSCVFITLKSEGRQMQKSRARRGSLEEGRTPGGLGALLRWDPEGCAHSQGKPSVTSSTRSSPRDLWRVPWGISAPTCITKVIQETSSQNLA